MPGVETVVDRSEAFLLTGRNERAVTVLTEALSSTPDNADLYGQLSRVFASSKNWKAALDCAQRAVDLEPEEPWWWLRLSAALAGTDDLHSAESAMRWGVSIAGGEWAPGLYMLGCVLFDQAEPEKLAEAEQVFLRLVELSPENADFRYMLANAFAAREKGVEADQQVEAGLAIDPFHTNLLLMRATNPARPADGRVKSLLGVLHINPNESRARASLESEYFRIRVRRYTAWWLLAVADAALLLWVPQVFYVLLVPFLWISLFFVALVNRDARKAMPKGFARRMDRKYGAATWAGRVLVAAGLSVPLVVFALYGDHGSVTANIVVSLLLVFSAVAYSVYRWLVLRGPAHLDVPGARPGRPQEYPGGDIGERGRVLRAVHCFRPHEDWFPWGTASGCRSVAPHCKPWFRLVVDRLEHGAAPAQAGARSERRYPQSVATWVDDPSGSGNDRGRRCHGGQPQLCADPQLLASLGAKTRD